MNDISVEMSIIINLPREARYHHHSFYPNDDFFYDLANTLWYTLEEHL
jgi:hypothetical protein